MRVENKVSELNVGQITSGIFLISRPFLRVGAVPQDSPVIKLSSPLQQFLSEVANIDGILGVGLTEVNRGGLRLDIVAKEGEGFLSDTSVKYAEAEGRLVENLGVTRKEVSDLYMTVKNGFGSVAQARWEAIRWRQAYSEEEREDPNRGMVLEFANLL